MAGRWETHRGDVWWYTDYWGRFDAGFNRAYPGTLSIDRAELKQGQLTESRLHNLLWATQQQFKENVIEVCDLTEIIPVLHALQSKGLLSLEQRDSSYSKCIKVTDISEPPQSTARASARPVRRSWWKFC